MMKTMSGIFRLLNFDNNIKVAYERYLNLPLATKDDYQTNEIYTNRWYSQGMLTFEEPTGHNHYTLLEFVYKCGEDERLFFKFYNQE